MTTPHLAVPARTIRTRGFSRVRHGVVLGVIGLIVAAFIWVSVDARQGAFAAVLLPLGALALALFGGPERLARQVTVSQTGVRVDRFHRVSTSVEWSELDDATVRPGDAKQRAVLILDPVDAIDFFSKHRELNAVRINDRAEVPIGQNASASSELAEALRSIEH